MKKINGTFKNISNDINKEMKANCSNAWVNNFSKKDETQNNVKDITFKDRMFS